VKASSRERAPFHCHVCGRWHDFPMCPRKGEPGEQLSFDDLPTHSKPRKTRALSARHPAYLQLHKPVRTIQPANNVL